MFLTSTSPVICTEGLSKGYREAPSGAVCLSRLLVVEIVNVAFLFREKVVVNLHQTRGRLFVNILHGIVGCGAANVYYVEIRGRIASRTVRRATAMAIRDALHRCDLLVSWLITRGAADDLHHQDDDVTGTDPDCTRFQREVIRQRRWLRCCAGSS
jgi:hypothetical protein